VHQFGDKNLYSDARSTNHQDPFICFTSVIQSACVDTPVATHFPAFYTIFMPHLMLKTSQIEMDL
jgi:hypothetical protein